MTTATLARNPELLVASIEITGPISDIGPVASKALPPGRRYRYSVPVAYTLVDGTKIDSTITGLTKPKLQEAIARNNRFIQSKCMTASQYDYPGIGKGWSFTWSMSIR